MSSGNEGGALAANRLKRASVLAALALACFALFHTFNPGPHASASRFAEPSAFARTSFASQNYPDFSHSTPQHARLACASCHDRDSNRARPKLPGHKACSDCHMQQFMSPGSGFCVSCHTDIGSRNPPVKAFPGLSSFDARFDHAQHMSGAARPEGDCAACHKPMGRGVALSIPTGAEAHVNCYQCHTPNARAGGRDISSCGACHQPGKLARVTTGARAFRVNFSHSTHGARQNLSCSDCHTVRAGLARGRQVSAPRPVQHFGSSRAMSCMTCHDNRRAFGGDDFNDCKRCHTGRTFRF